MNELEEIKIENMIYEVRGKQVMLDSDLYHVGSSLKRFRLEVFLE